MVGRFCRVEPLDPDRHARDLWQANAGDPDGRMWTYLSVGPFADEAAYRTWLSAVAVVDDPVFYTIVDAQTGQAVGLASYLRIDPANGVIEVGHLQFSPRLQRTPAATEAMYLMMRRAFDELGYRRYEWKCDSLNAPSRAAAERYGFRFEGIFRQAVIYKGRNRDTAWFSVTDAEWPAVRDAFQRWLDPANFDADGRQCARLSDFRTIFHITTRTQWEGARIAGIYRGDTLETEGFIHCSTASQVVSVANAIFRGRRDLVLLQIDSVRVHAPIRYEPPDASEPNRFPHIYGPLNTDAVRDALPFPPEPDGSFQLPEGVQH
jgi:uncharacterized protein (DUF952 family)/RimJ/RimL family protein N-acetyltransferase